MMSDKIKIGDDGEFDTWYESQPICPYCGNIEDECDLNESGDYDCGDCGKEFHLEVEFTAHYTTTKKAEK